MINYSIWPKKKISVTTLRLDISNPRLSETTKKLNQNEIIDYLIENEKVYELANDIVTKGYFLNEQPIVVKESGKYHVLEGNRRVSASKILMNPDLIKSSVRKTNIKRLLKTFDLSIIEKLECIVAPTREDADIMIVNRHTGGSAVEKWDKTKQDRFLYNRFVAGESVEQMASKFPISKTEIKNSIKRYNVYKELCNLDLDDTVKKAVLDETSFKMTNVERAYQFKEGLNFMGFDFDETSYSLIKKLPKEEFEKRMSQIAIDVVNGEINSRKLNDDADKRNYFNGLVNSGKFDTSINPDIKYNHQPEDELEEESVEVPPAEPKRPFKNKPHNNKLMSGNTFLDSGINRIDEIFYELKALNIKTNPNAVAVLFRSYLDMLSYQFLKKTNGLEALKLETISKFNADNDKKFTKAKANILKLKEDILMDVTDESLKKAIGINGGIDRSNLAPSLKYMLTHIANSTTLIEDEKLKQALQGYIRNDIKLLGHSDFNLLVHNEYYTADAEELKKIWVQIFPLLNYFVIQLKK
ncbi:ParB N-terminal domain-containing protein [Flavobacterium sp. GSA192]|uniref:ParB N-terminal domain-containing protein n=1 Tax=Flavobacterium sp. GSA192 TaxID=2576304 RepID=UPI00112D9F39|nr:ParB N-terminal domain-containing protein [Flavobacterium sp. GSA192]